MFYDVYKVLFRQYECFSVHVIVRDKAINQLNYLKQYDVIFFILPVSMKLCYQYLLFCGCVNIMLLLQNEAFVSVWNFSDWYSLSE